MKIGQHYYIIQAIHPYSDGNGRTGRLLYEVINNNNNLNKDTLSKLLDHDTKDNDGTGEGRDIFSKKLLSPNKAYYLINREVVKGFLGEDFLEKNGCIFFSASLGEGYVSDKEKDKLSSEEVTLAEKILGEGDVFTFPFRGIVLAKLIKEDDSLKRFVYELSFKVKKERTFAISEDYGKDIFGIDGDIMNYLDEKQIRRLIELHKELKEKFIMTMIDIFKNPDMHKEKDLNNIEYFIKDDFHL